MEISPIKSALSGLESELEEARRARTQLEFEYTGGSTTGGFIDPEEVLPYILNKIQLTLLVVLEAAALIQTRQKLEEKWKDFENEDGGIGKTTFHPDYDYLESKPLNYIETLISSIRILSGEALSTGDSYELAMLESILKKTPVLLNKRGITPKNEKEVRDVMHDYLGAFFTEYKSAVTISGTIRDFKPDCGVRNLKTAIEFKFADSQPEVLRAMGGIFEDISGYAGSSDWTRFYSVIYQTGPYESEDRIKSELTRSGTITWKALIVTGGGKRTAKK